MIRGHRSLLRRWLLVAAVTTLGACASPPPREVARDVLLITVDTLRADALGFAGNGDVQTPFLDRLATTGRVFDDAHAHSTVTLPSHANILTGLYPFRHGVRDNLGFRLAADQTTLAERLQAEGFVTAAVVAAVPLIAETGLDQGFLTYDDQLPEPSPQNPFLMVQRGGDEVVETALSWWQRHADQRRFLWVHLFEPHAPYLPPEPFRSRHPRRPYLGEVAATDAYLGRLLEPLMGSEAAETLVVFTSDHGESLGEHGEMTHGFFAYEATLKVPLVLWGPRVMTGRDSRPARHVDIVPTVLDAVGMDVPPGLDGASLLAAEGPDGPSPDSYFESLTANLTRGWAPLRGLIQQRQKAIDLPIPELYDLAADPDEEENLLPEATERLRAILATMPEEAFLAPERESISGDVAQQLQALGYLGGSAPGKSSYTAEDDLKNLVHLDRRLMRTHMLFTRGEYGLAAELARSILDERSDLSTAREYLAFSLLYLGRTGEAVAVMREAVRSGSAQPHLVHQLALTLTHGGRGGEAVALLEEMVSETGEPSPETLNALTLALIGAGRQTEAIEVAQRVLVGDERNVSAHENLALAYQTLERWDEARRHGETATALDGSRADAWSNLGVALINLGRAEAALAAWTRALEAAPDHADALFNLGLTASDLGQSERAERALRHFLEVAPAVGYEREVAAARSALDRPGPG